MTQVVERYRLVTRSDFDGLVCAALLKQLDMLEDILLVHPKDMQDGKLALTPRDITTNLPYVPGVHLAFDHHASETLRLGESPDNHVIDPAAHSAARVVYDHFGGAERFPAVSPELMEAVDRADAALFSREEIVAPQGWILLSFLMDPRTGLGRFRDFRISNYQLMMDLIDVCTELPVEEILALPDVAERVALYRKHHWEAVAQIRRCAIVLEDLVLLDLRREETIHPTNRFTVYAMFPSARVSMHVLRGRGDANTVFAVGKSILDRTSPVDIGALMLEYGGGGHHAAGTCQVDIERTDAVQAELIERLTTSR